MRVSPYIPVPWVASLLYGAVLAGGRCDVTGSAEGPGVPRVRVLVVDDQRLIRDGIASLPSIRPGIEVVGTAGR
ncbi:hypothetical protein [Streptomyces sp. 8K308]|uniref:hypothetical protein n=1 Tax=Streptomyces sp. 8K308 TaxID=2530388 RepID=UPI00326336B6